MQKTNKASLFYEDKLNPIRETTGEKHVQGKPYGNVLVLCFLLHVLHYPSKYLQFYSSFFLEAWLFFYSTNLNF